MSSNLKTLLEKFSRELPHFADGRIDYSGSKIAPVITCFVKYKNKILLLKRSDKVATYMGTWNSVAGYIDEDKPLEEKIFEELKEELGFKKEDIDSIKIWEAFEFYDKAINKTWIIHPALAQLKAKPKIVLDWEHTEYKWIEPRDLEKIKTVPSLKETYKRISA